MRTLFCIANMNARKFRTKPRYVSALKDTFPKNGTLCLTRTLDEARQALDKVYSLRPTTVMICGGDGTLQFALDALSRHYKDEDLPQIMVVPAGTMNVVFHHYSGTRHLGHLDFASIFSAWETGECTDAELPTLRSNGRLGFIFALGGFSTFIEWYRESEDPTPFRGAVLSALTALSAVFGTLTAKRLFRPFEATIEGVESEIQSQDDFVTISVASISHIGFGVRPFLDAGSDRLGTLCLRGSLRIIPWLVPLMIAGWRVRSPQCVQTPTRRWTIRLREPMKPMLDGEIFAAEKTFTLEQGPVWRIRLC